MSVWLVINHKTKFHSFAVLFIGDSCQEAAIICAQATWRPTSGPSACTYWRRPARQPVLLFTLLLFPLLTVFPPSVSPQGNCGVIYEVLAAWSRPVYGTACWPGPIQLQSRGPGLLLSNPQSETLPWPGPPSWLHSPCSSPQHVILHHRLKMKGKVIGLFRDS